MRSIGWSSRCRTPVLHPAHGRGLLAYRLPPTCPLPPCLCPLLSPHAHAHPQGHFKELESILRLLENGAAAEAPLEDAAPDPDPAAMASEGRRQTFLFSATLMLPPKARESNAKAVARHKSTSGAASTVDKLLRMIQFQSQLKVCLEHAHTHTHVRTDPHPPARTRIRACTRTRAHAHAQFT